jgi:hypothetical protein
MVSERIDIINNLIFKNAHAERADGLLHGKMGIAIYLYHLGRALKDKKYNILANKLIDQVYDGIGQNSVKTDFENGLAGIAWGIEHLVQKGFLNADTDEVLRDLDDKIFQYISSTQSISIDLQNGLLGYGFYLLSRLQGKDLIDPKDHDFLLKRLLIMVINSMYENLEAREEVYKEPIHFESTWNLPMILFFLSEVNDLDVHTHKIEIMFNRLSIIAKSIWPVNLGNRLFLQMSIEEVVKRWSIAKFQKHSKLLKEGLDEENILRQFQNKNVLVNKGLAGIQLILQIFKSKQNSLGFDNLSLKVIEKIVGSDFWKIIDEKEKIQTGNLGLFSGIGGVGLSLIDNLSN